ncbi:vesicle-associated protein 2-2-like protein [Tanacetum coccineum]
MYSITGMARPRKLRLVFKPSTQISCIVTLINPSTTLGLAFRVTDYTCTNLYYVQPYIGVIKPSSTCQVQITRQAQNVMPPREKIALERFLIQRNWVHHDTSIYMALRIFHRDMSTYMVFNTLQDVKIVEIEVVLNEESRVKVSYASMKSKIKKIKVVFDEELKVKLS